MEANPPILTTADLAAIRERESKATPGPWADMAESPGFEGEIRCCNSFIAICVDPEMDDRPGDRVFIANSRTDVPRLIATVEALQAEAKELTETLHEVEEDRDCYNLDMQAAERKLHQLKDRIAKLRSAPDGPTSIHLVLDALEDPRS